MCTESRRIKSRLVCLTMKSHLSKKRFPRNSSPTYLECKPRGLMTENNISKTIRQKIYAVFYVINIKNAVTCECGREVPSRKSVYFGVSKLILYFPYFFHVRCTVLFTMYFHTVLPMFYLLCY